MTAAAGRGVAARFMAMMSRAGFGGRQAGWLSARRAAVAGALVLGAGAGAAGELTPVREFAAPQRPLLVRDDRAAGRAAAVRLLRRRGAGVEMVAEAPMPAGEGGFDLVALFPVLRTGERGVVFAQGVNAAGEPEGAPLVLEPVRAPERAVAADPKGVSVRWQAATPAYDAGWRVYRLEDIAMETTLGAIRLSLRPDAAPRTARHVAELVRAGFYDGLTFHRVVGPSDAARPGSPESEGFVIQGGDPLGTGEGGPGYSIPLERSTLEHGFGTVSLARLSAPDTGGSQFFIVLSRRNGRALDGAYAAFATVSAGDEVVRAISRVPVGPGDRPVEPVVIRTARLVPAAPLGAAPAAAEPEAHRAR